MRERKAKKKFEIQMCFFVRDVFLKDLTFKIHWIVYAFTCNCFNF